MAEPDSGLSVPFYDPLSTVALTDTILARFERQTVVSLAEQLPAFDGAGLYAIYYTGASLPLYLPLRPTTIPVYVGSAQSHNSATGTAVRTRLPLWQRTKDHRRSIGGAELPLADFGIRLLLMPDVHIDLGENGLRVGYQPVWNATLRGFGSHEQGASTRQSRRSQWDTVHSGRDRTFGSSTYDRDQLLATAEAHIAKQVRDWEKRHTAS